MKKSLCRGLIAFTSLAALASCQDYDGGFSNDLIKKAEYAKQFEKTFGTPDPNQDWSMATLVKANVNLPQISGTSQMNILTCDPSNPDARLLAQATLQNGQVSIDFDAIKGADKVFVTVAQYNEYKIYSEYPIVEGMLNVDQNANTYKFAVTRAFSTPANCPTTLAEFVESSMSYVPSNHGGTAEHGSPVIVWNPWGADITKTLPEWQQFAQNRGANLQYNHSDFPIEPSSIMVFVNGSFDHFDWSNWQLKSGAKVSYGIEGWDKSGKVNFQYLTKSTVEAETAEPWIKGLGQSLVGSSGFFCEQNYYWGPKETTFDKTTLYGADAAAKLETMKTIEAGFKIKAKGAPIEIPFIYGATGNTDQFGYILYEDGEDPLAQPHYVLMDDARPSSNLYKGVYNEETGIWEKGAVAHEGTNIYYQWIRNFETTYLEATNPDMTNYVKDFTEPTWGTVYRLVYFDESGNASYNIPANKNVVFWLKKSYGIGHDGVVADNALYYSLPELNERVGNLYGSDNKTINGGSLTYNAGVAPIGAVKATSWYDGTHYYLGFEDGGNDEDLNDVVFWVDGAFDVPDPIVTLQPIKWHINIGKSHDTSDSDLFAIDNKPAGIGYSVPSGAPTNGDKIFLGWSQDENAVTPTIPAGEHPTNLVTPSNGVCWFAVWKSDDDTDPASVTIKWHKNYDGTHHTSDDDLHATNNVNSGDIYSKPSSNPQPQPGKVFVGWAEDPDANTVLTDEQLTDLSATEDKCYYAIYRDLEYVSWIFACEDLGGSFDYDFNDVVWEVRYSSDTKTLEARLLAAGGTLPFTLVYNSTPIVTKADAFGNTSTVFIQPNPTQWYEVGTVESWSASNPADREKFQVVVDQTSYEGDSSASSSIISTSSENGNKTPQVIVLPYQWCWPTEGTNICSAYTEFTEWVSDASWSSWSSHKQEGKTVNR